MTQLCLSVDYANGKLGVVGSLGRPWLIRRFIAVATGQSTVKKAAFACSKAST